MPADAVYSGCGISSFLSHCEFDGIKKSGVWVARASTHPPREVPRFGRGRHVRLLSFVGARRGHTTVYRPETDGLVERMNPFASCYVAPARAIKKRGGDSSGLIKTWDLRVVVDRREVNANSALPGRTSCPDISTLLSSVIELD